MNGGSGDAATQNQQKAAGTTVGKSHLRLMPSPEQPAALRFEVIQQHLQRRDLAGQLPSNPVAVGFVTEMIRCCRSLPIVPLLASSPSVHDCSWAFPTEDTSSGS